MSSSEVANGPLVGLIGPKMRDAKHFPGSSPSRTGPGILDQACVIDLSWLHDNDTGVWVEIQNVPDGRPKGGKQSVDNGNDGRVEESTYELSYHFDSCLGKTPVYTLSWFPPKSRLRIPHQSSSITGTSRHPKFLTKLSQPDKPIHAWDGLCGAVVNEHIFITSPNCPLLFDPPLGVNCEMWMRNDYRYGEDDPLSWPQPYCASRPYLSCLRLCERNQSDPDLPLFQLPIRADFLELDTSSLIRGPGLVILGRSMNFAHADDESIVGANWVEQLKALCLSVAETQRLVLEVEAISTFFSTIHPRFAAFATSPTPKADMDLVGCFTTDIGVAQQLHRAGVPIWVLRPLDDLVHTRIDKVVEMNTASGRVHLGTCPLHLPSMYVGSGADEAKYNVFDQFTRSHLGAPSVFAWTSGQLRSEPSTSWGKQNTPAQGVFSPYNQGSRSRKGHLKQGSANKFEVITHTLLPEIHPPWKDALLGVNVDKAHVDVPAAPFAFPRPDLFVTISDSAKRMNIVILPWESQPPIMAGHPEL
ncbi:hypothetical protein ARMGADRAFT_1037099 [Armillaria gallica]|uniref:Uncharacterized protein n=1 Tax=Armillaria gallica TaxID=47427 RepID=A0A2H3DA42_ARMGA|nr:hypothetical protein ARMGADRAFT_1037099 [Armillaria gallica]